MKFIGLDPSLVGTGLICLDEDGNIEEKELIKSSPTLEIEERLKLLNNLILSLIDKYQDHQCVLYMEGLSFASKGNVITQLAGLHYFLRINFSSKSNLKYKVIAPTTLKKYITGKGNSKKELIILEVYKRWGVEFKNNNLADAYSLARMAFDNALR